MPLHIGATPPDAIRVGDQLVDRLYAGPEQVWPPASSDYLCLWTFDVDAEGWIDGGEGSTRPARWEPAHGNPLPGASAAATSGIFGNGTIRTFDHYGYSLPAGTYSAEYDLFVMPLNTSSASCIPGVMAGDYVANNEEDAYSFTFPKGEWTHCDLMSDLAAPVSFDWPGGIIDPGSNYWGIGPFVFFLPNNPTADRVYIDNARIYDVATRETAVMSPPS